MVDNSAFDDIPGTTVFTAEQSHVGYQLNQFCMSLMRAENRERFTADQRAYLDEWPLSEDQKSAVIARDFNRLLSLGGNIYFLSKIFATDGLSYVQAVSSMTDMSVEEYQAMMLAGGRNIEGWRSVKDGT
jgi:protocatechuate 4,5-dioxygenase, alpha chain